MAIVGFYDPDIPVLPPPSVSGFIYFLRLGVGGVLTFVVDTGSDRTSLHCENVERLGVDYRDLAGRPLGSARGVGGSTGYYHEPALLLFHDSGGGDYFCRLEVAICEYTDDQEMREIPSLLGRDFLNRCDLRLNPSRNLVSLEPLNVAGEFVEPYA